MAISAINSIAKPVVTTMDKVVPQPKMVKGLENDTFQKNTAVTTNPINTYKASAPVFMGLDQVARGGKKGGKKGPKKNSLPPELQEKVNDAKANIAQKYGKNLVGIVFERNIYAPKEEYTMTANLADDEKHTEFYDNQINKIGEEDITFSVNGDAVYMLTKNVDYRNNTTSKVRAELDDKGYPIVTDEVRIVKDKDNKVVRKEMMTHSKVTGAYDHKYVYPDGTEKVISKTRQFKKYDGMDCIHKDMTSLDGTRTQYKLEQDKKGNKLLEYKITDKDGNVLMNLNKTMERVSDNKIISSNGDKVYEVTFDPDKLTIQERGKEPKVIEIKGQSGQPIKLGSGEFKVRGDRKEMFKLMKQLPADQLLALTDTIKTLNGVKDTNDCCMFPNKKQIDTINEVYSVLHEAGHGVDFRKSTPYREYAVITADKELLKIYNEEREAFNKEYPNAQRDHVGYFIQQKGHYGGKLGGLSEVVAEANALRDSYTTEFDLGPRAEYLQQYYPKTIAYLNTKLSNYKAEDIAEAEAKNQKKPNQNQKPNVKAQKA